MSEIEKLIDIYEQEIKELEKTWNTASNSYVITQRITTKRAARAALVAGIEAELAAARARIAELEGYIDEHNSKVIDGLLNADTKALHELAAARRAAAAWKQAAKFAKHYVVSLYYKRVRYWSKVRRRHRKRRTTPGGSRCLKKPR